MREQSTWEMIFAERRTASRPCEIRRWIASNTLYELSKTLDLLRTNDSLREALRRRARSAGAAEDDLSTSSGPILEEACSIERPLGLRAWTTSRRALEQTGRRR